MADFTPTQWVDNALPAIGAGQLNRMEAGILDAAVNSKQRGPLTGQGARPAAAPSNKNWFWIDSATGAMSYSDGTAWYAVGGSGGSSSALYDQTVTAQTSVTVGSLPSTNDGYDIEIDGVIAQGGAARTVAVLPNGTKGAGSAGNYLRGQLLRSWIDAAGAVGGPASYLLVESGFVLSVPVTTEDVAFRANMRLHAKTGAMRIARSSAAAASVGASVNVSEQYHTVARWVDTTTAIASLVIDFGGGTFTGRIAVNTVA